MLTETMAEAPPRLLTVAQAADYLQVKADTIRRWCRLGTIRCINLGDRAGYRIRQEDLDRFLESRQGKVRLIDDRSERAKHLFSETDGATGRVRIYEVPDLQNPLARIFYSDWLPHEQAMAILDRLLGIRHAE